MNSGTDSQAKVSHERDKVIWGTRSPRREFLHADDRADALVHLLTSYSGHDHVNVGSGDDIPILELARLIAETFGFTGETVCDTTKPDGTPRKLMSADRMRAMAGRPAFRSGTA